MTTLYVGLHHLFILLKDCDRYKLFIHSSLQHHPEVLSFSRRKKKRSMMHNNMKEKRREEQDFVEQKQLSQIEMSWKTRVYEDTAFTGSVLRC